MQITWPEISDCHLLVSIVARDKRLSRANASLLASRMAKDKILSLVFALHRVAGVKRLSLAVESPGRST